MDLDLEPVERDGHVYYRVRRDLVRSSRLRAFDECVGEATRDRRYREEGAAVDQAEVEAVLAEASRECAARTMARV